MDNIDRKIIKLLQEDARQTIKDIGNSVRLTSPAVSVRISRLEESGAITGYHASIDASKLGKSIEAFIRADIPPDKQPKFTEFCEQQENIVSLCYIIGSYNVLLHVFVEDTKRLEAVINETAKFGTTNTSIVLSFPFREKSLY